jgi:osmoprotectant transport system ATP-binding protein
VASGETTVILGRSGAGKSSALRLVNRLLEPTAGTVRVGGRPTTEWDPIALRRRTGYVIQRIGLFPHRTVAANVALVPRLLGWERERLERTEYAARYPAELSGGQQQRVGVARALAADPPILLADEPFGALDPITRRELQAEFRRLATQLGKAVLFVTHDVREARRLGDRIVLLAEGRVVFAGSPAEFGESRLPAVVAFRPEDEA